MTSFWLLILFVIDEFLIFRKSVICKKYTNTNGKERKNTNDIDISIISSCGMGRRRRRSVGVGVGVGSLVEEEVEGVGT